MMECGLTRNYLFGFLVLVSGLIIFGITFSNRLEVSTGISNSYNFRKIWEKLRNGYTYNSTSKVHNQCAYNETDKVRNGHSYSKTDSNVTGKMRRSLDQNSPVSFANISTRNNSAIAHYERCLHIPKAPKDFSWGEDAYIHFPPPKSLMDLANSKRSIVNIEGPSVVNLGEKIKLKIELRDGHGRKMKGKDLVRVWMIEPKLKASSVAKVTDNMDGSYDAEFVAFWTGQPTIKVAIISPKEVLATQFRRRYMCPDMLLFIGVFGSQKSRQERTTCSYYPQIPGKTDLCNMTELNFGRPWYCAKPRTKGLTCKDWTAMSQKLILQHENLMYTPIERQMLRGFQTKLIPTNITVEVKADQQLKTWTPPKEKCNIPNRTHTWVLAPPAGFMYGNKWTTVSCTGRERIEGIKPCVKNLKVLLIGDSTVRQIITSLASMIPCMWGTRKVSITHKHEQFKCSNEGLNTEFEYNSHELPFRTTLAERKYFKSIKSHLEAHHKFDGKHTQVVILIHIFSHFVTYHTHVFYESLIRMKPAIIDLLNANPNASVLIKGPHSYAFQFILEKYLYKPEGYLELYEAYIRQVFYDVRDRVIYLDFADITVSQEVGDIHPAKYIVDEMVYKIFDYVCKY